MARKILKIWLKWLAAKILRKYHPRIIAITGSTGKTSTKDAVLLVLRRDVDDGMVSGTKGNMNTEFGVTATIINPEFAGTAAGVKTKVTIKDAWQLTKCAFQLLTHTLPYPKILVLELAADRPGDIKHFISFIRPEVGIITNIGDVHLEFFGSKAELVEEKSLVISHIAEGGLAILNQDDDFSKLISRKTLVQKIFISAEQPADWYARDIGFSNTGIHFGAMFGNQTMQIDLPVFGYQFVYAALTALAVGSHFRIRPEVMKNRLSDYRAPDRRFNIVKLGATIIIDDTYNANPTSVLAALKSLARLGLNRRKVAILGDMKELGSAHERGHSCVGEYAGKVLDQLWVTGDGGALIKEAAIRSGLPLGQARDWVESAIPTVLQDNSIVLVKGSQAAGMDKIVTSIRKYYERSH